MALIKDFKKIVKQRNSVHNEVNCTYTIFKNNEGKNILQLDTYGSKEREYQDKISQSIQFDKTSIKKLMKIIINEFY